MIREEMINISIDLVMLMIQQMALIVCLEHLLTPRQDRGSRTFRYSLHFVITLIQQAAKILLPVSMVLRALTNPVFYIAWCVFLLVYFYEEKTTTKFAHWLMLSGQIVLADIFCSGIWGKEVVNFQSYPFKTKEMAMLIATVTTLGVVLNMIYTTIILNRRKKNKSANSLWLVMLVLFAFVFIILVNLGFSTGTPNSYTIYIGTATFFFFAFMMSFLSQTEKKEVEKEMLELQNFMKLEKIHYEQIESRREEMAKIRHDYNNVIHSILYLIENGETEQSKKILEDLEKRMSQTRECDFCSISIINAILTEKSKICEEAEISFKTDLVLPEVVETSDLDLCMIFGNLMDNAIRACKEVKENGMKPQIILTAKVVQDYVVIKCKNTALEKKKKIIQGTGYGQQILTDIAMKYNGDFQTSYENGFYVSLISLRNHLEEEQRN